MKSIVSYFPLICAATIGMSGCGGGGSGYLGSASIDPRIQELGVAGNWISECYLDSDNYYTIEWINLTNKGVASGGYQIYEDANCRTKMSGRSYQSANGTFKLGQQIDTLSGLKVYELDTTIEGNTTKNIIHISGNSAYFGVEVEGDTRPGRINLELGYNRETPIVTPPATNPGNNVGSGGNTGSNSSMVGTWYSQCLFDSESDYYLVNKITFGTTNVLTSDFLVYFDASCQSSAGEFSGLFSEGIYSVGKKFTDTSGIQAYELDITLDGESHEEIFGVNGGKGYFGVDTTNGSRPRTLDLNIYYTK